jgi:hypothetical protein
MTPSLIMKQVANNTTIAFANPNTPSTVGNVPVAALEIDALRRIVARAQFVIRGTEHLDQANARGSEGACGAPGFGPGVWCSRELRGALASTRGYKLGLPVEALRTKFKTVDPGPRTKSSPLGSVPAARDSFEIRSTRLEARSTEHIVRRSRCSVRSVHRATPPTRLESHRIKGQACAPKAEVCLITVDAIDPFASVQSRWLSVPPTIRTATLRRRLPDDASEQFCSAGLHRVIRQRVGNRRARFGVKILTPHVLRLTIAFVTVCS